MKILIESTWGVHSIRIRILPHICFLYGIYMFEPTPEKMKNDKVLKFELTLPRLSSIFVSKKWPWWQLLSKNCRVTWISAYLLDCLVDSYGDRFDLVNKLVFRYVCEKWVCSNKLNMSLSWKNKGSFQRDFWKSD